MASSNNDNEEIQLNNDSDDNNIPDEPSPSMRRSERNCRVNRRFQGDDWVNLMHWRKEAPSRDVTFFLQMD